MTPIERRALLYGDDLPEVDTTEPAEAPDNVEQADWHARQAQLLADQAAYLELIYGQEKARLEARLAAATAGLQTRIAWHRKAIEGWHRRAHTAGQATKTFAFPSGFTAKLRKAQPACEVYDPEALLGWAEENGLVDVLFPRPKDPGKQKLKDTLAIEGLDGAEPGSSAKYVHPETGAVVPGVRARVLHDTWSAS